MSLPFKMNKMKQMILMSAMMCVLGMSSCTKPKDECTLTNFYRTEWGHNNSVTISFSYGMVAQLNPPNMFVYEGMLDVLTDNEPDGLYHYGVVDDLCSIEKVPKSGWHDGIRLKEGHGYIIRHTDDDGTNHYCRFILKEWIHDTTAKGIDDNPDVPDTTIVGIHLLIDNEWDGK